MASATIEATHSRLVGADAASQGPVLMMRGGGTDHVDHVGAFGVVNSHEMVLKGVVSTNHKS